MENILPVASKKLMLRGEGVLCIQKTLCSSEGQLKSIPGETLSMFISPLSCCSFVIATGTEFIAAPFEKCRSHVYYFLEIFQISKLLQLLEVMEE